VRQHVAAFRLADPPPLHFGAASMSASFKAQSSLRTPKMFHAKTPMNSQKSNQFKPNQTMKFDRERHSLRAAVVNQNAFVGKRRRAED
jgi:hypothetical protein